MTPRRICRVCGGRRIPVEGLDRHPNCYPDDAELWPLPERLAYLAERSTRDPGQTTTETPSTNAVGATRGKTR